MKIPDTNGIVIDGFPRDIGQALSFEDQVCFQKSIGPIHMYCHTFLPTFFFLLCILWALLLN